MYHTRTLPDFVAFGSFSSAWIIRTGLKRTSRAHRSGWAFFSSPVIRGATTVSIPGRMAADPTAGSANKAPAAYREFSRNCLRFTCCIEIMLPENSRAGLSVGGVVFRGQILSITAGFYGGQGGVTRYGDRA